MHESESEVPQLCLTLRDPMDCSLLGSSVHGIFQARVLEWVAIAFSVLSTENVSNFSLGSSICCDYSEFPLRFCALSIPLRK